MLSDVPVYLGFVGQFEPPGQAEFPWVVEFGVQELLEVLGFYLGSFGGVVQTYFHAATYEQLLELLLVSEVVSGKFVNKFFHPIGCLAYS